jgi:predicted nucleic acid-binding protein
MRIVLDTNVILDVALSRKPFVDASAGVLRWAERNRHGAGLVPHSLATVYYLIRDALSEKESREWMSDLLRNFTLAPFDNEAALRAVISPLPDYEDALIAEAAVSFHANRIVTRDLKDFRKSPVPAVTPEAFLKNIGTPD